MFIVVWWNEQRQGYQTFDNDFKAAMGTVDWAIAAGCRFEIWWFDYGDERKWYRLNFFNNDKHNCYVPAIG